MTMSPAALTTSPIVFSFRLPTRVHVGEGLAGDTGRLAAELVAETPGLASSGGGGRSRPRRALLVTDPGVRRAGIADGVASSLQDSGFDSEWFDRVSPNPKDVECEAGAEVARGLAPDVVVAVGGGSVIDAAKAIALLSTHPGRVRDYEGRGKVTRDVIPIVAVPTTAGTGSEVTRSAVITDTERKVKFTVKDVRLAPALAVVDPATTYNLPADITASTGMDAFVHALEAYTCRAANPMSDALAAAAMELISSSLRTAVRDGRNKRARYNMMVGSLLAGIAFSHSDVAAVHCLAEALGGLYDTPHGVANSMFLPVVTASNAPADPVKHARAAAVCGLPVGGLSESAAASLLVEEIRQMAADIRIPEFSDLPYVDPGDFERLADAAFRNGSTRSNCRELGREDYLALLHEAYGPKPAGSGVPPSTGRAASSVRLTGGKVFLRFLEERDAPAMRDLHLRNREFFRKYITSRNDAFYTLEGQREAILKSVLQRENGERYSFGVFLKDTGELIGNVTLSQVLRDGLQSCFIGYYLDERQNGQGYMTEAVRLAVDFAFGELGLHRIEAGVMPHNVRSLRVLERAGFHKEGVARKSVKINGRWEDHQVLAIISDRD